MGMLSSLPNVTWTVLTTIVTFVILHIIIEPYKARKRRRSEKLKNLYAPLYTMTVAKIRDYALYTKEFPNGKMVFSIKTKPHYLADEYIIEFLLNNSGYASKKLLFEIYGYVEALSKMELQGSSGFVYVDSLVKIIVKEYNQLKKRWAMNSTRMN
ncbi:hypothetical protein AAHB50_07140 [Bacillus toyonensis]